MTRLRTWLAAAGGLAIASYGAYVARAWRRYGRQHARAGTDELLDTFMPAYDVRDLHQIAVGAPPEVTFAAAKETRLDSSRAIRAIFKARQVLMRGTPAEPAPGGMIEQMTAIGWGVLAERPDREIVLGAATKPWEPNPVFRPLPPDEFAAFVEPGYVKIAWTLRASAAPGGGSVFHTETRAVATDTAARRKFRRYWALLSPGIILIRQLLLPAVKAAAERRWRSDGERAPHAGHAGG